MARSVTRSQVFVTTLTVSMFDSHHGLKKRRPRDLLHWKLVQDTPDLHPNSMPYQIHQLPYSVARQHLRADVSNV